MTSHLTLPLAVAPDGRLAAADQNSAADLACSLRLLVATRPGERASVPGYGSPEQTFGLDLAGVADAVADWEPRVRAAAAASSPSAPSTAPGVLPDGAHLGFYLLDGSLLLDDLSHPGFYTLVPSSHLVPDPDDPGFFNIIPDSGADQSVTISLTGTPTSASEAPA